MKNKSVLFVVRLFAPPLTGGTIRLYKYCKYLVKKNYKVYVLCNSINKKEEIRKNRKLYSELNNVIFMNAPGIDVWIIEAIKKIKSLFKKRKGIKLKKNEEQKEIKRIKNNRFSKVLKSFKNCFATDIWRYLWVPFAVKRLKKYIFKYKITNIITSSPSFSTQLIGLYAKNYFDNNIFWITDFRDLWSLSPNTIMKSNKIKKRINSIEENIITKADLNFFISNGAKQLILKHFKLKENKKKHLILIKYPN